MKKIDLKKEDKEELSSEKDNITVFEWRAEKKSQKDQNWQIGGVILLLIIIGLFIWQENYFGSLTMLIVIFLIFIAQQGKEEVHGAVLRRGIRVKNELFPWRNLESFWIFEDTSELYLKTKKSVVQNITIPIKNKDAERIRKIILKFLPEKEAQRSINEIIVKKLGL